MTFTKITAAGAGTMGKGKALHQEYAEHFINQRAATQKQIDDTFARLTYTTDLVTAVRDADLVSESVTPTTS